MPNTRELDQALSRRERRKNAQAENEQRQRDQDAAQVKTLSDAGDKPLPKPERVEQPRATMTRKEQRRAAQKAAEAQAARDAKRLPEKDETEELAPISEVNPDQRPLTLHELNQRAEKINAVIVDEATQIGRKIGSQTRDLLIGREPRGRHSRFARQYAAEADAARQQKQGE